MHQPAITAAKIHIRYLMAVHTPVPHRCRLAFYSILENAFSCHYIYPGFFFPWRLCGIYRLLCFFALTAFAARSAAARLLKCAGPPPIANLPPFFLTGIKHQPFFPSCTSCPSWSKPSAVNRNRPGLLVRGGVGCVYNHLDPFQARRFDHQERHFVVA